LCKVEWVLLLPVFISVNNVWAWVVISWENKGIKGEQRRAEQKPAKQVSVYVCSNNNVSLQSGPCFKAICLSLVWVFVSCVYMCVRESMCVRQRQLERNIVCVCVRERERDSLSAYVFERERLRGPSCSCTHWREEGWVSEFITWPSGIYFFLTSLLFFPINSLYLLRFLFLLSFRLLLWQLLPIYCWRGCIIFLA